MRVELDVMSSEEYYDQVDKMIDYDENDKTKVSLVESELIQNILTTEASIYLLRRSIVCGSLVDDMVSMRRDLITKYETNYEPYNEYNDFY